MSLIPWRNKQPERELMEPPIAALRGEVGRLFDAFLHEPFEFGSEGQFLPAVDIEERDNDVIVRAELPGIEPKDLDVSISGNQLILSGEKKERHEEKQKGFFRSEIQFGSFRRVVPLPEGVDPDKVDAHFSNGMLTLNLTKTPASAPKRIPVKAE